MKTKLLFLFLICSALAYSQFNVSENFDSSAILPPNWGTQNFGLSTGSVGCSSTNSARATIFGSSSIATLTTPSYTSDGNNIKVAIKFRGMNFSSFAGQVNIAYEINNSNSWVPLNSSNIIQSVCLSLSGYIATDVVAAGATVRFRFTAVRTAGQVDIIFDDFTAAQQTPELVSEYTFNNTRNNTVGTAPFSATDNSFGIDRNAQVNSALITNNVATAPVSNLPLTNSPRTISLWFRNINGAQTINIFKYGGNVQNQTFGCYLFNGLLHFQGFANDTNINVPASSAWNHLVVTYNRTVVKMYLNGAQIGTNITFPANTTTSIFTIGAPPSGSGINVIYYDDLKIYSDALKQADIVSLYNNNTLSYENFDKASLEVVVYPNPATNLLNIETPSEIKSVEVYNIQGQKVLSASQKQINLSNLQSGVYVVIVEDFNNNITHKKIVKK